MKKTWLKLLNFIELRRADNDFEDMIEIKYIEATLRRLEYLSYACIVAFVNYAFVSYPFIKAFRPDVSLWDNFWPRILFNALPLMLLARLTSANNISVKKRLYLWCAGFCLVFDAAAMIYVWPIAFSGKPEIMLYVGAANATVFGIFALTTAPSPRQALKLVLIQIALLWAPLLYVVHAGGNELIFTTVANDTVSLTLVTLLMGIFLSKPFRKVIAAELKAQSEASKFLGPVVSRAVFENKKELLDNTTRKGFFLAIDIRGSTEACKINLDAWSKLRQSYFRQVSMIVKANGGYIHKTVGDHHLISFGIMDDLDDLSDIPGLDREIDEADERRLSYWSKKALSSAEQIANAFHELADAAFPGRNMMIGCGLDKGTVNRGVQGSEMTQELDVTGDAVNCCCRLEQHSKDLIPLVGKGSSILVMSPFASDYLDSFGELRKVGTLDKPVRNFPGIKWVLVKELARKAKAASGSKSAA